MFNNSVETDVSHEINNWKQSLEKSWGMSNYFINKLDISIVIKLFC